MTLAATSHRVPSGLIRVPIPASRGIAGQLGYHGPARWIGFWWDEEAGQPKWCDGADQGYAGPEAAERWRSNTEREDWLSDARPMIEEQLGEPLDLGDEGAGEATHIAILDREEPCWFICAFTVARELWLRYEETIAEESLAWRQRQTKENLRQLALLRQLRAGEREVPQIARGRSPRARPAGGRGRGGAGA